MGSAAAGMGEEAGKERVLGEWGAVRGGGPGVHAWTGRGAGDWWPAGTEWPPRKGGDAGRRPRALNMGGRKGISCVRGTGCSSVATGEGANPRRTEGKGA